MDSDAFCPRRDELLSSPNCLRKNGQQKFASPPSTSSSLKSKKRSQFQQPFISPNPIERVGKRMKVSHELKRQTRDVPSEVTIINCIDDEHHDVNRKQSIQMLEIVSLNGDREGFPVHMNWSVSDLLDAFLLDSPTKSTPQNYQYYLTTGEEKIENQTAAKDLDFNLSYYLAREHYSQLIGESLADFL
eukprot:gene11434-23919_t